MGSFIWCFYICLYLKQIGKTMPNLLFYIFNGCSSSIKEINRLIWRGILKIYYWEKVTFSKLRFSRKETLKKCTNFEGHTGKVGPRTLRWDQGPSTFKWDPMVGTEVGTLRETLGWDLRVETSVGTLRWNPSVRRKSSHLQLFFKIGGLKYFAIFTGKHQR